MRQRTVPGDAVDVELQRAQQAPVQRHLGRGLALAQLQRPEVDRLLLFDHIQVRGLHVGAGQYAEPDRLARPVFGALGPQQDGGPATDGAQVDGPGRAAFARGGP